MIVTTVDVTRMHNNREHHLLRHLGPRFGKTYVVYRRKCQRAGWREFLRDALIPSAKAEWRDGVCYVEANPLLNHVQGLAMDVAGTYQMQEGPAKTGTGWRQRVFRLLSGIGIWKDFLTVLALTLAVYRRVPGQVDICTAMGPHGNAAGWLLRRLGKVRMWHYEDRDYEPGFFSTHLRRYVARGLEVFGLRRADLSITIGYRLQRLRKLQTGRAIDVVTTGVDAVSFQAPLRRLERPVLVYTGNVTFWSGLDMVVAALPTIRAALPGATLLVVGEALPGYLERLQAQARECGVESAITFTGRVPNAQVKTLLAQAHLGVATFQPLVLRRYAFPLKVLEYMASGLPCIGTAGTETEDILRRQRFGVSVPFAADAFAKAAVSLLTDPQRYQELAENARRAAPAFEWPALMAREHALMMQTWQQLQDRP